MLLGVSMLLGVELHIYTDHKDILNVGDLSERRLRWISYVDEYGPTIQRAHAMLLRIHFQGFRAKTCPQP